MHDNVIMVVTTLAQYLFIAGIIGALFGFQLARANDLGRLKTMLRGGSVGFLGGAFVVGTVTTFLSLF